MTSFVMLVPEAHADTPILNQLWPTRGNAYSMRVEWLTDDPGGREIHEPIVGDEAFEYNYCEIVREQVVFTTPPSGQAVTFKEAWTRFLLRVEGILASGERRYDHREEKAYCGGIGTLGLTLGNAQLVFLREPRLLPVREDLDQHTILVEFSLRRIR